MIINIAHRGASGLKPENTRSAFLEAVKYADAVELDVRLTKDKKIVVVHDAKINRTSNGKGVVKKLTLRELRKYDYSYKLKKKRKKRKEKILTLDEFLDIFKDSNIKLIIEIKPKDFNINLLLKKIQRKNKEKIILISFHYFLLKKIYNKDKKIKLGYIIVKPKKNTIRKAKEINCISVNPLCVFCSKRFINKCHKNNLLVFPWALNNKRLIKRFIKLRADGIVSNYPNKVNKIFKELKII